MAYVPIDPDTIKVGDPITKELWDRIKNNFDDIDTRLNTAISGSGKIALMNEDILVGSNGITTTTLTYEVIQDCIITEGAIQLFSKNGVSSGSLTIDVKKNSSTNPAGFNSVFSVQPTLNMASATDYQRSAGVIDPAAQSLAIGTILKLDIISLPVGIPRFRVNLIGEF